MGLLTSNFYSILYYNSEVWHIENLNSNLKQLLLSASARALKICMYHPDPFLSFKKIHEINKRALPEQMMVYKHALMLYRIYNLHQPKREWMSLNFQQVLTSRQTNFKSLKVNKLKIGNNSVTNRLSILNGKIPLDWLNKSYDTYKVNCKKLFNL